MAHRHIFIYMWAFYIFSKQTECHPFQAFDKYENVVQGVFNRLTKELIIQFSDLNQNNSEVQDAINLIINGANGIIDETTGDRAAAELKKILQDVQDGKEPISAAAKKFKEDMIESSPEYDY
ncbi:hypothetical protein HNY73_002011 [Argiope bruennichi]|uniref:Uncharacterized protein n=1 Tax=Argiope bruennichi TaxID=94029 RepID=A0A8T0FUP0_ARGBR|nr:hypothetical protein HNY73_002011 [Argiope bruennichi]